MLNTTRFSLAFLLSATLFACAGGSDVDDRQTAPTDPKAADVKAGDEDHLGHTAEEMKWVPPACSFVTWVCGQCICNACGVEDCRAVVYK
jgi:hypothetical protein